MNLKTFLLRFAGLLLLTLLGGMLFAITFNILITLGLTPTDDAAEGFGNLLTQKTVLIYMCSIVAGFVGIFIRENWRWVLYLCPLYAPSVFAVIYTLTHR